MNDLRKLRDLFRESADILDRILELEDKEKAGEDVKAESESLTGRFMFKMLELQAMQG